MYTKRMVHYNGLLLIGSWIWYKIHTNQKDAITNIFFALFGDALVDVF